MQQDTTAPVLFLKMLQWIKNTMGLMSNEQLIATLQYIHNAILTLMDDDDKRAPVPAFLRQLLVPKGNKGGNALLEEQANSVQWGIRIVQLYDTIEKREAQKAVHKQFPTKTVIVPRRLFM